MSLVSALSALEQVEQSTEAHGRQAWTSVAGGDFIFLRVAQGSQRSLENGRIFLGGLNPSKEP